MFGISAAEQLRTMDPNTRRKIDDWWMHRHLTFMFPPMYRGHTHIWNTITSECVGCTACGVVHVCSSSTNIVPCSIEQQDDTSRVCTYTGIVLNSTSFFDPEASIADYNAGHFCVHSDSHAHGRTNRNPSLQQKVEVLNNITASMITLLFFSKQAHLARETERIRYNRKIASLFTSHVSRSKNSFASCNILEGIESCIQGVSSYRQPIKDSDIPPLCHFRRLQRVIVLLLSRIHLPRQYIFSEQNEKMRNLVISLVYISSDGISFNGSTFLPKFAGLKKMLPLELVLYRCFGIQPKIVTDGENVIKISIKNAKMSPLESEFPHSCDFATTNVCTCHETTSTSKTWSPKPARSAPPTQDEPRPTKMRKKVVHTLTAATPLAPGKDT